MYKSRGFTLIEIAIVLVIIGLLLGGVLKGQELITSARVRNLISQQDGVKAAYFGFLDRFRALPGDYASADRQRQRRAPNGNDNGQIETIAAGSASTSIIVWEHLSTAGFINGSYTYAAGTKPTFRPRPIHNPCALPAHHLRQRLRCGGRRPPSQPEERQSDSLRPHGRDRPQDRRR